MGKILNSFPKAPIIKLIDICYSNERIIGLCIGYLIPKKKRTIFIQSVFILNFRNKPIGEYLLQIFLITEPLMPCSLTVYKSAKATVNFYKKYRLKKQKLLNQ